MIGRLVSEKPIGTVVNKEPRVSFEFRWFDLRVGFCYNEESEEVYFCPLPMFCIVFCLRPKYWVELL